MLLAAGLGTRLRPITDNLPKCLVPILGKPLLQHWLEMLFGGGISDVLINTHYLPQQVRAFREASRWRDRITLVHEDVILGTGGTVLANRSFFCGEAGLVAHADNLTFFSVADFLRAHASRPRPAAMTMMTFDTDAPQTCGIVETDTDDLVVRFHEKVANPPGTRANGAVYIFEPEVIAFIASLGKPIVDLSTEVIPHFLGRIATYHNSGYHRDIGSPESLRAAEREYRVFQAR
jgi:mannose-1-phosphate guanylyltransferase